MHLLHYHIARLFINNACGTVPFPHVRPQANVIVHVQQHHRTITYNIPSLYPTNNPPSPKDAKSLATELCNSVNPSPTNTSASRRTISILTAWITAGPPPLSSYKLTFGKHRGKTLDQVPDAYLVKYLIPNVHRLDLDCPLPRHVVEEYIQRHPEVKSQAGREKAEGVVGRVVQEFEKSETRGRPRKGEERRETYWEKRCRPI